MASSRSDLRIDALFGFLGPPDPDRLARMSAALAHRGRPAESVQLGYGSIAGRASAALTPGSGSGLYAEDGLALALSGFLTSPRPVEPAQLLARYRAQGPTFLRELRGQFVLALLDGDRLLLARDSLGARTAFFGRAGPRMLFAVEPKGIWTQPDFDRRLRPAAVAQYLTFSYVPGAGTMLEGLHEVLPGHVLTATAPGVTEQRRWSVLEDVAPAPAASDQEWVARFRAAHRQAVADRLPSAGKVGVFLSGGVDSSAVTAELAELAPGRVCSYAIHFGRRYPNELPYARAVADHCGVAHREVQIRPKDFLDRLPRIVWHLDSPIGDPITAPNYVLAETVAAETPWAFNGEGGDPLFGGPKNLPMLLHHWYGTGQSDDFRLEAYLASYRRAFDAWRELLQPDFAAAIDADLDLQAVVAPWLRSEQRPLLHRLLLMNARLKGAHLILPKVEAMTAAHGLTALSPLFDERLAEFALSSPPHMKLRAGIEKYVLKQAFADRLPAAIIERPKSGMRVPVQLWLRREMRRYARRLLAPDELRRAGIFNTDAVARLLAFEPGAGRPGLKLWMLITFELWRRMVFEQSDWPVASRIAEQKAHKRWLTLAGAKMKAFSHQPGRTY